MTDIPATASTPKKGESKGDKTFVIDMLFHSFLVLVLLSAFYWFYASQLITRSLNGQIDRACSIAKNQLNESEHRDDIRKTFKENRPDPRIYDGEDESVKNANTSLQKKNLFMIYAYGIFICALYAYYTHNNYNVNIWHVLLTNILLLFGIAIIEIWFFTSVARRYIPATPEFMMISTINAIEDELIQKHIK
jgi:hypothetical protein